MARKTIIALFALAAIGSRFSRMRHSLVLILYVWEAINLIIMLNLHLKLRGQLELITALARTAALLNARYARGGTTAASNTSGPEGGRVRASRLRSYGPKGSRRSIEDNRPLKIRRRWHRRPSAARAQKRDPQMQRASILKARAMPNEWPDCTESALRRTIGRCPQPIASRRRTNSR
jgi:hypothetical protein